MIYDGNPSGIGSSALPWLCFTGAEDGSTVGMELLGATHPGLDLDISRDGGQTWTTWDLSTVTLNDGQKMWLRGDNRCTSGKTGTSASTEYISTFTMTGKIKASGSIMSLLYRNAPLSETFPKSENNYGFSRLFMDCVSLLTPPDLPAVKCSNSASLPNYAYSRLFFACVNLQYAPLLPAKNGSIYCYAQMFFGCFSLKHAPEIELETVSGSSCLQMFLRCTSMLTPPSILKATAVSGTSSANTYRYMFGYCEKLQYGPKIMMESPGEACYSYMFAYCTALTKAPDFPEALTARSNIYDHTFFNCTSLAETQAEFKMLKGTASVCDYMFAYCTSLRKAPDIRFAEIQNTSSSYWFRYIFAYCSALEEPGEFHMDTEQPLFPSMFANAFYYCTALKRTPNLPWTNFSGASIFASAFAGCTSLEEAPEVLPAMTLTASCYATMFSNCYALRRPPRLPATTLAATCYQEMFAQAKSLESIPELPAITLANGCYRAMFSGAGVYATLAKGTVDFVLPAAYLPGNAYYQMFYNSALIRSLDMRFTEAQYQTLTTANMGMANILAGCEYIKWIKVAFTDWGTTQWRSSWCGSANSHATFYKPRELPSIAASGNTYIATWTVVEYDPVGTETE